MLASTQTAGLSRAGPVASSVTSHIQMSRPSWERPIETTVSSCGRSATQLSSSSVSSW